MRKKELKSSLKDCKLEIKKINSEQFLQSGAIQKLEKKLKEVENEPPFKVTPKLKNNRVA